MELRVHLLVLAARLSLQALSLSQGHGLLTVVLEPPVQLVVQHFSTLEYEVSIAQHLDRQSIIKLLDLGDVSLPKKNREPLDLRSHTVELICQVVRLALDDLATLSDIGVDLSIGVDVGVEVVAEGSGGLAGLDVDLTA